MTATDATSAELEETLLHEYMNTNLPQENMIIIHQYPFARIGKDVYAICTQQTSRTKRIQDIREGTWKLGIR